MDIPTTATDKTDEFDKKETKSGSLLIDSTLYFLNVRFGKIPLEDILKNRILNGTERANNERPSL